MTTAVKALKHPYITMNKKLRGGAPIIVGTGLRVLDIAVRYELMGLSVEDIVIAFPQLTLPQIHDALSYYYEHKPEIDKEWKDSLGKIAEIKDSYPSILESKIGKIKNLHR